MMARVARIFVGEGIDVTCVLVPKAPCAFGKEMNGQLHTSANF